MIPSAGRGIFLLPPTAFFCIRYTGDPFHQQGGDFSQHIGWELGKILTWREKFRHGGKNSDMVGKIPPWKWDMVGKIPK
jgi:hypothetical protein